jgi:hypothetical protein
MKIAFAIDLLLERTPEVQLLELLLAGHEDADVYCLAHVPGALQGEIERHRIIASPLGRLVSSTADLARRNWLLPSAARHLKIAADVEQVIVVSSGWAHVFPTGPSTRKHVWLYRFDDPRTALRGLQRVFAPYHRQVKLAALPAHATAYSSEALMKSLGRTGTVIAPSIDTEDFVFVPDESHPGDHPHHTVLLGGMDRASIARLVDVFAASNVPAKLLGDPQGVAVKGSVELVEGIHCSATTAAFTHGARSVWALGDLPFPEGALGALCCGRPVVVSDSAVNREFLGKGVGWYTSDWAATLGLVERDYLGVDRKSLRRQGLRWNGRLFKARMRDFTGAGPAPQASSLLI